MKTVSVSYQKVFPLGSYINEKIGVEIELEERDGNDALAALDRAKDIVETFHKQSNPGLHISTDYSAIPGHPMSMEQKPAADFVGFGVSQTVSQIIKEISECKEVSVKNSRGVETGLKAYEQYVKVYEQEFPQIRGAYENQLNKINQSQRV